MKKTLLLTLILLLNSGLTSISAQQLRATYPVQVSAFLKPPYSLYPAEYCNSPKEKLIVQLLNRDLQESELHVRLHLSIHAGNGITIETKDYNNYPAIRLSPGIPYQMTQTDLCPYLQLENCEVQGVLSNGRLPEGMIEICIRVFEVNTGRLLSQTSCARAWITLNRPPLLNLPSMNTEFPFRDPVNMLFQWTPRHQALSNVEYEFILKEIWENDLSPEAAFPYSQEIYRTTTRSTSLAYTAMQPPLLENKKYAWQVRAVVRDGFEEVNVFENQGYSEVYAFSISQSCNAPSDVKHHQDMEHLVVEWTPEPNAQMNVVAYRGKGSEGEWHFVKGNENYANISDLSFDTEYEYKVGTVCVDGSVVYSPVYVAVLENWRKDPEASCGVLPAVQTSNKNPLPELNVGDVFLSGDFPVTVMSVTGKNGTFSGTGWIRMPLVAYSKVAVKFDKISINTEKRMTKGFVETSYDKTESQIFNGNQLFHGGGNTGQTKTGAVTSQVKTGFPIPDGATATYNKETGEIEIRDENGNLVGTIPVPEQNKKEFDSGNPTSITVQDENGNTYVVTKDEDGNLTVKKTGNQEAALPEGSFSETEVASKKAIVEFYSLPDATYAFDKWKDHYRTVSLIADEGTYEHIESYEVPCQLIPPGKTERVGVKITILDKKGIKEDSIIFKTKAGYTVQPENGILTLNGGKENDAQDLYALYPDGKGGYWTLGKLKILSYTEPVIDLVLVPIHSEGQTYTVDVEAVRSKLKEAYKPLGISWNVSLDDPFDYYTPDLDSEGSDLFSRYTDEMKQLNGAYMDSRKVDKKTVYIFILRSGNIKGTEISGDMPRGKQFGYVFTSSGNLPWTIAHEVAHGKFKLRHTFDEAYGKGLEKETDNLMNYNNGTYLAKWQWDEIFDPAMFVNPFESDEDGMRKGEAERGQISRLIYAMRDVIQKHIKYINSEVLTTDDIAKLNLKKDFSVKADHIFYNQYISDYFEEVEVKLFFDAKKRQNDFLSKTNQATCKAWYVESLDAVIAFIFKKENDLVKFKEFIGDKDILTPPESSKRKAFFVHGTSSDSERWMEHPLTKTVLLCIANTNQYDDKFSWEQYNHLLNDITDRNKAAQNLIDHVMSESKGLDEIVLIGHSHGGNVSLQAANQLSKKGKTVYLISTSTPAYNELTVEALSKDALQNCEFVREVEKKTSVVGGVNYKVYEFKNPENPKYTQIKKHIHLWNKSDGVAGELAGANYYSSNGITENVEIFVGKEYIDFWTLEFINAHGFDANRPQLIYGAFLSGNIKSID